MRILHFLFLSIVLTTCKPETKTEIVFSSKEFKIDQSEFFQNFPYPAWFKDQNSVIVCINRKYEEVFKNKLKVNTDLLIGKKGEIFDSSTYSKFITHDNLVKSRKRMLILQEDISINGKVYKGTSYKFTILDEQNKFQGHMGYWVPDDYTLLY